MKKFTVAFVDRFCDVAKRSEYTVGFGPHTLTFRQGVAKNVSAEAAEYVQKHASRRFLVVDDEADTVKKRVVEDVVEAPVKPPTKKKAPGAAVGEVVDDPAPKKPKKKKTKSKKGKK